MAEGKGECCIARWGAPASRNMIVDGYNGTSKMDMIMMKYRPIAPKPVAGSGAVSGTSEGCTTQSSGSSGRHTKGAVQRGRKKTVFKENNNSSGTSYRKTSSNGRKRKSTSPDNNHHGDHDESNQMVVNDYQKADLTLLPLFPEAPDLSSTSTSQVQNMVPFWLNFDNTPCFDFEDNIRW